MDRTEVPLQAIVGSFERCADYTRSFLPLKDHDQPRWTRVEQAFVQSKPLPPIQVMKVEQAYFVVDGHHRVSVARQLGLSHLEAEVLQVDTQLQIDS
jgi:ParB-like chromosome segregation protein Spo0J